MSDTGGGHRAAARAIQAALEETTPGGYTFASVDVWKEYFPPPFNRMPTTYTAWVNASPRSYGAQYWLNDRLFRLKPISAAYCAFMSGRMRRMYTDYPADVVVCVHSVFVRPAVQALRRMNAAIPFVTVITDWALPTVLWYDPRPLRCCVPTDRAFARGKALGIPEAQMIITGAPIHPKFTKITQTKAEARAALGWSAKARIVLMVAGGDGMGPLVETAQAVDALDTPCELVIVAGRNAEMKTALEGIQWRHKAHLYGFVETMPAFMRAADVIITKAGPATITEAAAMGLPLILNGAIPHQETPNIDYVIERGAGVYAPGAERAAAAVAELFSDDGSRLKELSANLVRIAQPDAVWRIAEVIQAAARP